jgi:hypothetical protein
VSNKSTTRPVTPGTGGSRRSLPGCLDIARAKRGSRHKKTLVAHASTLQQAGDPAGHLEVDSPATQDQAASGKEVSMNEATARAMIQAHFDASNVAAAGGGPEDDIVRASEIYADDAVVEWPQGGERLRGKANIIGFRSTYPARQQFELHRTTGCHDLWVNEYTIRYDDQPVMAVGIMEFRDDKVVRERIYFGEPWKPPAWRAQWVERFDPRGPEWPANERQSKKDRST